MAEVAVSLVMEKLTSSLRKDVKLLRGIHEEVEDIKVELEFITCFLKEADARAVRDQDGNSINGVKTWVKLDNGLVGIDSLRNELVDRLISGPSVRTIVSLVGSSSKSQVHSIIAFQVDFKFLKEVDFAGVPLSYVSEELGDLLHLRYSSLRYTKVKMLPESIGVDTLEGDEFCIELGRLKKLKKLGSSKLKPKHGVAFCTAIEQMNKLQSLSISSIKDDEFLQLQSMSYPPVSLRKLCLRGRLTKLPDWVSKLHNLVRIGLHWSRISDDSLKILGVLPKLLKLTIDGAVPSLEWLSIGPSPYLEELPWTISCLNSLKHLTFHNMPVPHSFARRLVPNEGTDHWKVKHTPNAVFYYTNGSMQCYVYKLGDPRLLQLRDLLCFMQGKNNIDFHRL
ncbi:hypothetical protein GOBAR_AA12067 [Gossypium barbadense]|uniref:Uncharacterized protein n=1 Tax=Gossypium barbadense TaxID=3634 RepID=A0A2P5XZ19_GOSBA|nr:hypothetical protein GOBAR_AA12067 [Gossypium barbadense]